MGNIRITYRPRPEATPEGEVCALAEAYRLILQVNEDKKEGARPGARDDMRKDLENAHTAESILP